MSPFFQHILAGLVLSLVLATAGALKSVLARIFARIFARTKVRRPVPNQHPPSLEQLFLDEIAARLLQEESGLAVAFLLAVAGKTCANIISSAW